MELESKVGELEALLETASHENSVATCRMNKMEGELQYYKGLHVGSANQRNSFTSYPSGKHRHDGAGGDMTAYSANPAHSYVAPMPSLLTPALTNDYQRIRGYDSSRTVSYSPTGDTLLEYWRLIADQTLLPSECTDDSPTCAYLPVVDDGS